MVSVDEPMMKNRQSVMNPIDSYVVEGKNCGSGLREEIREVVLDFPHADRFLTVYVYEDAELEDGGSDDDSARSWAISDFRVYVQNCE